MRSSEGVASQPADGQVAALVAAAVADEEALACGHPAVQRQILAVITNIIALAGPLSLCFGCGFCMHAAICP